MTYQVDTQRNGAVINAKKQLTYCIELYTKRFKRSPKEVLVGPCITQDNLIIKSNEIYMVIDETTD